MLLVNGQPIAKLPRKLDGGEDAVNISANQSSSKNNVMEDVTCGLLLQAKDNKGYNQLSYY